MTQLRLYDTYAREKRIFAPAEPDRITLYVCGPTVYNRAHIGNARPAVVFDVLARLLRHLYPERQVIHAANVTDIEDKIMAAAAAEGVPIEVITERYARFYFDDLAALGVPRPDIVPLATETITGMVAMIATLIGAGNAYSAEGHVLFDVPSFPDYGKLSRRPMDEMIAGARVDVAPYKRSPADFVLWKPSAPDQPGWESPWGRGRPGWHIECSAMIEAHFGETIDIHGGGLDLEFPHHENEIAQSACAHGGAPLARYWLHNGMVSMAEAKMSKSLGNVVRVNELLDAGNKGATLRMALLSAHYRQPLEWTQALTKIAEETIEYLHISAGPTPEHLFEKSAARADKDFVLALCDDLNVPVALQRLHVLARKARQEGKRFQNLFEGGIVEDGVMDSFFEARQVLVASAKLLGFELDARESDTADILRRKGHQIATAIERRRQAKHRRDFAEADRIRAELLAEGILLEDSPNGTSWRRA